jgi:PAS domain S-box-containing protein
MSHSPATRDDLERRVLVQYAVSRALAESESVEQATSAVLAEIGTTLGWDLGSFLLIDPDGKTLRAVSFWPDQSTPGPLRQATQTRGFAKGEGLPGQVWQTGVLQWLPDAPASPAFIRVEAARREGVHAALAFPVVADKKLIGVVEFFSTSLREPDDSMSRTLTGLGLQIGVFLERQRALDSARASQLLTAATLHVALDSVVTIDAAGSILEFNPAAERTFGYARADVLGKQMNELIVPPRYREAHKRGMARYLDTGEAHVLGKRIELAAMRADGSEFPVELAIQHVPIDGPAIFTAYIRDLSAQAHLKEQQQILLDASETLASSIDYEETLANLSKVIVPRFADWYVADVADERGVLHRLTVAHRDPAKVAMANELAERYPPNPDSPQGVAEVMRTGKSQLLSDIPDDLLVKGAVDDEHLRLIRGLGLRSYMLVPLRTRDVVVGALTLVTAESGRRYDATDLVIAEQLARQAGQAIENSRLHASTEEQRVMLETQSVALEETAAELEATVDELRAANEDLQHQTAASEHARREADDANKAKSVFLASMSHELRTPLNAIIGYAQLMEMGIHGPPEPKQLEDLGRIVRNAHHLLVLINHILTFAKVEAGRIAFTMATIEMGPVLTRVEEMIAPQAKAKDIEYLVRRDCMQERVHADAEKLMQIMINLLSNAIRHTERRGKIEITCQSTADSVLVAVIDNGAGIPEDKLEEIFEPFLQLNPEYSSQRQGAGLGLAISRHLARGMGGDITVTSRLGAGSTFTLALRRA